MKKFHFIVVFIFLVSACSGEETDITPQVESETPQGEFFANLFELCGETFSGEATYPEDTDHVLVDTELEATISTCTEEMIEIDLVRGGDTWHTAWILEKRDEGLHLIHDHLGDKQYEEGEEPLTSYGGYANNEGSSTAQYFPADEHTAEMLPEAATNVWMMELNPENETFVYSLERHNELRFKAELSKIEN